MRKFALIVAGGSGSRMNSSVPKQFILLKGVPVLMHTINVFRCYDPDIEVILVLPEDQILEWNSLCEKHWFKFDGRVTTGGQTRFYSVKNGLDLIQSEGIVFIHDGVRPLVSVQTIERCFKATEEKGNALPVIPVSESVRKIENGKNIPVDRAGLMLVQTPQTFRTSLIKEAYKKAASSNFTDDASVLEAFGEIINLVEGNRGNIKITFPEDLKFAESILSLQ